MRSSVPGFDPSTISTVLCDLDGVVWLAHDPIAGSVEAISRLRSSGRRVVFVTNNSVATLHQHTSALAAIGVPAEGDVLSSATAAALLVERGERVLVTGGPGIVEAVERRGAVAVSNDGVERETEVDAVIVGLDRTFTYDRLSRALHAVLGGARLIATNTDSTFPTASGLEPGGGAIVAAVSAAAGVAPTVAGKPHDPMARAIQQHLTVPDGGFDPIRTVMVGDRMETDGLMAARIGCRFALVRSGVPIESADAGGGCPAADDTDGVTGVASGTGTGNGAAADRSVHLVADDLRAVADVLIGRR